MPIPPKFARKLFCESCGWKLVIRHRSDAMIEPTECLKCGNKKLTRSQANEFENLIASTVSFFNRLSP
jgi:predicted RNA-binding Zn-ribbon protein involved in translation (DUF1610 family)